MLVEAFHILDIFLGNMPSNPFQSVYSFDMEDLSDQHLPAMKFLDINVGSSNFIFISKSSLLLQSWEKQHYLTLNNLFCIATLYPGPLSRSSSDDLLLPQKYLAPQPITANRTTTAGITNQIYRFSDILYGVCNNLFLFHKRNLK